MRTAVRKWTPVYVCSMSVLYTYVWLYSFYLLFRLIAAYFLLCFQWSLRSLCHFLTLWNEIMSFLASYIDFCVYFVQFAGILGVLHAFCMSFLVVFRRFFVLVVFRRFHGSFECFSCGAWYFLPFCGLLLIFWLFYMHFTCLDSNFMHL